MSYVLIDVGNAELRTSADTPLAALQSFHAHVSQDRSALIRDEAGHPVQLPQLLKDAIRQAADPTSRRQLASALADYVDLDLLPRGAAASFAVRSDIRWQRAGQTWALLFRQPPPDMLLQELARRRTNPRCDLLVRSAETELVILRRTERSLRLARDADPRPTPPTTPRPSSRRGM
jgi:hypothetical protein